MRRVSDVSERLARRREPGARRLARYLVPDLAEEADEVFDGQLVLARLEVLLPGGERLPRVLQLARDADVAGARVALAAARAAYRRHRHRREAHAVGPEHHQAHHVAPGLHAAVGPQLDAPPQPRAHQ